MLNASFPLTTTWESRCYGRLYTPSTDTTLTFSSTDGLNTSYLVDDLGVGADPRIVTFPPGGGVVFQALP